MKRILKYIVCYILLFMTAGELPAQQLKKESPDVRKELSQMLTSLRQSKRIAFKQLMVLNYEDGTKDSLLTDMAYDMDAKCMYSKNKNCELTLNRDYYTRVDHQDKTISVFDMKLYSRKLGMDIENDGYFNNDMMLDEVDSMLNFRLNTIESRTKDNIITFNVTFPLGFYIKSVEIQYHKLMNIPVKYAVTAQFRSHVEVYNGVSSYQVILYDYTKNFDDAVFLPRDYMRIRKDRVDLSRYKDYHLTTLL